MSFLLGRNSLSFGGPDEDFTGREVPCCGPDGTEVGTAVLLEQIAFAGFSHVYKAFLSGDNIQGQVVAAKVLTTGYSHTATKAEPLLKRLYDRELAALTAVQHKHVIELLGVGEICIQPDSPERVDTPTHGLGTPSIDEHAGPHMLLPMLNPSMHGHMDTEGSIQVQASYPTSIQGPSVVSGGISAAGNGGGGVMGRSRTNSYTASAPFLPFHKMQTPAGMSLPRLHSAGAKDETSGLKFSPSIPIPPRPPGISTTGVQPSSPSHVGFHSPTSNMMDPTSYLPKSLSGQAEPALGARLPSGQLSGALPGTPQVSQQQPISVLFAKQGSFRQSFLSRAGHHRPMPSLTFSTRRSVTSVTGAAGTRRVLFIQWMPGGDARTLIDQAMRPMEESAAATIILPIAQALGAAHKAGIVHRDVKAGNILLAPGPRQVRLADWGISVHEAESSSRMSTNGGMVRAPGAVGTEFWCAPEIELGYAHDQKSDLFSLAITFIELVTGKDPKYENSLAGFEKLTQESAGLIPDCLSMDALDWLVPCLSFDPTKRPSIDELLAHPFFVETLDRMDREDAAMLAAEEEDDNSGLLPAGRRDISLVGPGAAVGVHVKTSVGAETDDEEGIPVHRVETPDFASNGRRISFATPGSEGGAHAVGPASGDGSAHERYSAKRRTGGGSRLINATSITNPPGVPGVSSTVFMMPSSGGGAATAGFGSKVLVNSDSVGGSVKPSSINALRMAINTSASRHSQDTSVGAAGNGSRTGSRAQHGSGLQPLASPRSKSQQPIAGVDTDHLGNAPFMVDEGPNPKATPMCGCMVS